MKRWTVAVASGVAMLATAAQAMPAITSPVEARLTRAQALERADHLFDTFDANRDGLVTVAEAREVGAQLLLRRAATGRDVAPGIGGHTLRFFEHAFAGVQAVTRPQFEQAMLVHFDQMDSNHDGVLTAAERKAAHQLSANTSSVQAKRRKVFSTGG